MTVPRRHYFRDGERVDESTVPEAIRDELQRRVVTSEPPGATAYQRSGEGYVMFSLVLAPDGEANDF